MGRKRKGQNFDTIHDILRRLSLVQSLLEVGNAPIWRIGNRRVNLNFQNVGLSILLACRLYTKPLLLLKKLRSIWEREGSSQKSPHRCRARDSKSHVALPEEFGTIRRRKSSRKIATGSQRENGSGCFDQILDQGSTLGWIFLWFPIQNLNGFFSEFFDSNPKTPVFFWIFDPNPKTRGFRLDFGFVLGFRNPKILSNAKNCSNPKNFINPKIFLIIKLF